ncbi:hypothetical protein GCM10007199_39070 [Fictibacillus barbaricus]|nr:hypothetical protein GCM10007199_39070 [Fictibacillus barbaricus]
MTPVVKSFEIKKAARIHIINIRVGKFLITVNLKRVIWFKLLSISPLSLIKENSFPKLKDRVSFIDKFRIKDNMIADIKGTVNKNLKTPLRVNL